MTLNHNKIRQILHILTIIIFSISVLFQLKNLYVYGGKPPKAVSDDGESDDESDNSTEKSAVRYDLMTAHTESEPIESEMTEEEKSYE